jgi:hypothetical protein
MWRIWPIFGWGCYRVSYLRIVKSAASCVIGIEMTIACMGLESDNFWELAMHRTSLEMSVMLSRALVNGERRAHPGHVLALSS